MSYGCCHLQSEVGGVFAGLHVGIAVLADQGLQLHGERS